LEVELHLEHDDGEPHSFAEADGHAAWRAVMQLEMDVSRGTGPGSWLISLPATVRSPSSGCSS
jgi:hypothetical protein